MAALKLGLATLCLAVLLTQGECVAKKSKLLKVTTTEPPLKAGVWTNVNPDDPYIKKILIAALNSIHVDPESAPAYFTDVDFVLSATRLMLYGGMQYKIAYYTLPKGKNFARALCNIYFNYVMEGDSYKVKDIKCDRHWWQDNSKEQKP